MKNILSVVVAAIVFTLVASNAKEENKPVALTQQQTQCFDVAQSQAKAIPGKDVYYSFAVECGSKEEAHAFRTGAYTKA